MDIIEIGDYTYFIDVIKSDDIRWMYTDPNNR